MLSLFYFTAYIVTIYSVFCVGNICLFQSNDAVTVSDCIALHSRMTVNNELERMLKEVVVA